MTAPARTRTRTRPRSRPRPHPRVPRSLRRDTRGAAALEAALVIMPFIVMLLCIVQTGVYYMSQAALDAGVLRAAEAIRASMVPGVAWMPPNGGALTATVATSGAVILAGGTLAVDLRPLASLTAAALPITDGVVDAGSLGSILVVRATVPVISFAPGMSGLAVTSSAILRRPLT